jgi:hypothetical protein
MFLFHGTRAKYLPDILAEGLIPIFADEVEDDWTKVLTGKGRYDVVFLSTSPVGSLGGNPVSFALGWPKRREKLSENAPGAIVVVDLPYDSLDLILAVVPNGELDAFAEACRVRTFWLQRTPGGERASLSHWCLFYWLYRCVQEHRIPFESEMLRARVPFHVEHRDPELPVDLTPPRWQMFIDGYFDLMESPSFTQKTAAAQQQQRILFFQQSGLRLPDHVLNDPHMIDCYPCIQELFRYSYSLEILETSAAFRDFLAALAHGQHAPLSPQPQTSPYCISGWDNKHIFKQLPFLLRLVALHVTDASTGDLLRFFVQHEASAEQGWTWEQWFEAFPLTSERLPEIWRPTYGKIFRPQSLKWPDHQIIVSHIPPAYILGVIIISDSRRLLPHAHHQHGKYQPLARTLWRMAHDMRKTYRGKPIVRHLQEYSK